MQRAIALPVAALLAGVCVAVHAAPVTYSAAASNPAGIQSTVDDFRTALGVLNPSVAGSFGSGRREINWDGVPDSQAAPNALSADFFNVTSPRGVVLATPGTGFQVSANSGVGAVEFGNINASYPSLFAPFSAQRLFTALGSNILDVNFFVPGSATPATVSAFGAVFTDVDLPDSTFLSFFDPLGNGLGSFAVPNFAGSETLSFLGVRFTAGERIGRVRIISGNAALGGNESGNTDLVVMDDFIYAEPVAAATVAEPASLALVALLLLALASLRRRGDRSRSRVSTAV